MKCAPAKRAGSCTEMLKQMVGKFKSLIWVEISNTLFVTQEERSDILCLDFRDILSSITYI